MQAKGRRAAILRGIAAAMALGAWAPAWAETAPDLAPAGTYLAARAAGEAADFAAAADLFAEALQDDPANPWLLDNALAANLGLGRFDAARELATRTAESGVESPIAHLTLAVAHAQDGDWRAILQDLEAGRSVGPLADGLARAWARMALGDTESALSAFDELAATPGLKSFGLTHKALALALSGDLEGAEAILSLPESEGMQRSRRSVLAQAEVLSALGRDAQALALLDEAFGGDLDATTLALRARLEAGETLPFTFVASPAEGLAEVYLNTAAALGGDDARTALIYARAALALDPSEAEAALLAASLLEELGQPGLAREAYALVPATDPAFVAAELGYAGVLRDEGREEAALEVLSGLAQDRPDLPEVQVAQGDLLRAIGRYDEAEAAYDRAIGLYGADTGPLWYLHFTRALTREAQGDWPGAEADLRRSLELRPNQPQVLNHLGYTLVDRGERLDEALGLIEAAVDLSPDSGAIVDSLGWAYYKLGRHAEAVEQLERAASLGATDPVINDHLGDAYWSVGREREARFQWARALSFDPAPQEAERIRTKLAEGLAAPGAGTEETASLAPESTGG